MALLRELIQPSSLERCGDRSFPVLSMTMHDGIMLQSDRFKKSLASIDQSAYKVVRRNQLVVGFPIDEGVLYIQQVADAGIMSPAYDVWNVDETKVDLRYFELCLHSPQSMMFYKTNLRGTTARRRSLPKETLLSLHVPVPSMERQREIATTIGRLKELIELRQRQLRAFDTLIKARFVEMFGDPVSNPKQWNMVELGTLTNVGSSKRIFEKEYVSEGVPFYRTKEIVELSKGNQISTELFITYERFNEIKQQYGVPQVGDLLISAVGTIGVIWIVDGKNDFYYKDGNLIRVDSSIKFNSVYMKAALESLIFEYKKQMSAGTAYAALTISGLSKMKVYNVPIDLQDEFANFVSQVDKSKVAVQAALEKAQLLFDSLMQQYFG